MAERGSRSRWNPGCWAVLLAAAPAWAGEPFNVVEASIPRCRRRWPPAGSPSASWSRSTCCASRFYEDRDQRRRSPSIRARSTRPTPSTANAAPAGCADRCTASRSRSRTTSTPPTCRPPAARWRFAGLVPPYEATLVTNLRAAGAIVLAKTQMTELANWVAGPPGMPTNYNSLNGYGFNPYDPRRDPRERQLRRPAGARDRRLELGHRHRRELLGSERRHRDLRVDPQPGERQPCSRRSSRPSGGSAATASSRSPPTRTPPVRWRAASPTRRSCSASSRARRPTPNDPATSRCRARDRLHEVPRPWRPARRAHRHSARLLLRRGEGTWKRGAAGWSRRAARRRDGGSDRGPEARGRDRRRSCRHSQRRRPRPGAQLPAAGTSAAASTRRRRSAARSTSRTAWSATSISGWPRSVPPRRCKSLTELRQWNRDHQKAGTLKYGQALLDFSDAMDPEVYRARYEADRAKDLALTATHGIDEAMTTHRLDALLFPGPRGANLAARPGYPTVMVPFGTVAAIADPPFPDGFDPAPLPLGVELHRHRLQRAAPARSRLRLRAGDAHARVASWNALILARPAECAGGVASRKTGPGGCPPGRPR